jgi:hypothetical protein
MIASQSGRRGSSSSELLAVAMVLAAAACEKPVVVREFSASQGDTAREWGQLFVDRRIELEAPRSGLPWALMATS